MYVGLFNGTKLPKGKYKYVVAYKLCDGSIRYRSKIPQYNWSQYHETERQAAVAVDKKLISKGCNPVNILVAR